MLNLSVKFECDWIKDEDQEMGPTKALVTCIRIVLADSIQGKAHRIRTAFTRVWIDFLSCSHVTG